MNAGEWRPTKFDHSKRGEFEKRVTKPGSRWVFRGVADADWPLSSTLDRVASKRNCHRSKSELEFGLLDQFRRKAHLHGAYPPSHDNIVEWLALVQHYGCPTRLLDFTYSYRVALFFACNSLFPADGEKEGAVWAIDSCSHKTRIA